jgi:hypothetical protein
MSKLVRLRAALVGFAALFALPLAAQDPAAPCCGAITPAGEQLNQALSDSGVDQLWLPGTHVDWQTGAPDRDGPGGPGSESHCSAFVAAFAQKLGVYILRPPEHGQVLLANAQRAWLSAPNSGWTPLPNAAAAQAAANQGQLVVASFAAADPHRPGHIVFVRAGDESAAALQANGPPVTSAGMENYEETTLATAFRHHPGAWNGDGTGAVAFFAHAVDWSTQPQD